MNPEGKSQVTNPAKAHGINTFFLIDYGDSLGEASRIYTGKQDVPSLIKTFKDKFLPLGFKGTPWQDEPPLTGPVNPIKVNEVKAGLLAGFVVGAPAWGWGYDPIGFNYNLSVNNPHLTDYMLKKGGTALQVASACPSCDPSYNSIAADNVSIILGAFNKMLANVDSQVGLKNLIFLSGSPLADHGYSSDTIAGTNAGHNINSYVRFTATPFYSGAVSLTGTHLSDASPCLLWPLRGTALPVTTGYVPTLSQAQDVDKYHRSGVANNPIGYDMYMGLSILQIEDGMFQTLKAKSPSWNRTAFPPTYLQQFSGFLSDPASWELLGPFSLFAQGFNCVTWFNIANPLDNSSNSLFGNADIPSPTDHILRPGYSVATADSILKWFTQVAPLWAHNQALAEVDSDPQVIVSTPYVSTTSWPHFGGLLSRMPFLEGLFGYVANAVKLLYIGHYLNPNVIQGLHVVANVTATDSYRTLPPNLSQYDVIMGVPDAQDSNYANDIAAVKAAVQGGVNMLLCPNFQSSWGSMSDAAFLTGVTMASGFGGQGPLSVKQPSHPILAPYAAADLVANWGKPKDYQGAGNKRTVASSSVSVIMQDDTNGPIIWTNRPYGLTGGQVAVVPVRYNRDGFNGGDAGSDQFASGASFLMINALLDLKGLPTPAISLPKFVSRASWANPLDSNGNASWTPVIVSICGTKAGGKLVWISNGTANPVPINLILSSAFYGFTNPYALTDINTGATLNGFGDVVVNVTAPPSDWMPFYSLIPRSVTVSVGVS